MTSGRIRDLFGRELIGVDLKLEMLRLYSISKDVIS